MDDFVDSEDGFEETAILALGPAPSATPAPPKRRVCSATDWTRALIGGDAIVIPGFGAQPQVVKSIPWLSIGQNSEINNTSATGIRASGAPGAARIAGFFALALSAAIAAFVLGGVMPWGRHMAPPLSGHIQPAPWQVVAVGTDGVTVKFLGSPATPDLKILLGKRLPDGQVLLQTEPTRKIYRTSSYVALVRGAPH
ncbi:MAG: hypothetical protein EPN79_11330 [Burkholderiaceae bacterium]|nr:MAG: hypothetical protein EPN79_11330 [Burkholderiaceae bacterium]TBR76724.1 MAG: hypothetical protein EPN64_05740 [Burkholderiaceae bacterium]